MRQDEFGGPERLRLVPDRGEGQDGRDIVERIAGPQLRIVFELGGEAARGFEVVRLLCASETLKRVAVAPCGLRSDRRRRKGGRGRVKLNALVLGDRNERG